MAIKRIQRRQVRRGQHIAHNVIRKLAKIGFSAERQGNYKEFKRLDRRLLGY